MVKLTLLALIISVVIGALIYRFFYAQNNATLIGSSKPFAIEVPSGDVVSRVSFLESSVSLLNDKIKAKINDKSGTDSSQLTINAKLNNLDDQISDLNSRLTKIEQPQVVSSFSPSPSASSTSHSSIYIPLGPTASSANKDWYSLEGFVISLDPANFSGYTGMKLEIVGKLSQAAGTGSYRLYNETDSSGISLSEVLTTGDKYTLLSSSSFKLATGAKTYRLQIKHSLGYETWVQSSRIKVDF